MSKSIPNKAAIALALFNADILLKNTNSKLPMLQETPIQCNVRYIEQDSSIPKNFKRLVKHSPFVKYPAKRVTTLDVPHRFFNLSSLEIYENEPDSPVSPGLELDDSDLEESTEDSRGLSKSILKKGKYSRYSRSEEGEHKVKEPFKRKKLGRVTIVEDPR